MEETPKDSAAASRGASSEQPEIQPSPLPSSPLPQFQHENNRVNQQRGFDLQRLQSSLDRLSVTDWSFPHQSPSIYNQRSSQGIFINGGDSQVDARDPSRNLPCFSRNRLSDHSPNYGSSTNGFSPNFELENARGSIVLFAKDEVSCNWLIQKIVRSSRKTIDMVFEEVISDVCDLMVHPCGRHFIVKLMEGCSAEQITQILDLVTRNLDRFIRICNDPLGSLSIRWLMRCLRSDDQIMRMVDSIRMAAVVLTKNNNADDVILQCFRQFSLPTNRRLVEVISGNCYRIATDRNGCKMIMKCIDIGCYMLKQRLIHGIISNALHLCLDRFGNYVVQHVLELHDWHVIEDLMRQLVGNYAYLSCNQFGSHVVQKLLETNGLDTRFVVMDLLGDIDSLLVDQYGNYVIQTAWFVCNDDLRGILWECIKRNINFMRNNKFGRKFLEKLDRYL
ncbi:unnamed protein product [Cochlearia groenlandica]